MDPIGTYDYTSEAYSLDFMGRLPLPTLGNYLLDAATRHAEERGAGYTVMEGRGTAWVLSRLAIEVIDTEGLTASIRVSTWAEAVERIFIKRCFEVTSAATGKPLAYARSIWAAIDKNTRRPTSLVGAWADRMMVPDRHCPVEIAGRIAAAEEAPDNEPTTRVVRYSDLDINGHLNSIRHMEAMLDGFDLETYRTMRVQHFEISYHAEGRYGTPLALFRRKLEPGAFACALVDGDRAVSRALIRFV